MSPALTAFLANMPAPSMTLGFEVFVHDVIAAITTLPCRSEYVFPSSHVNDPDALSKSDDKPKPLNPI